MKKKIFALILAVITVFCASLSLVACNSDEDGESDIKQLTVYNCEDYIDEDIFEGFSEWYYEQTGVEIEINYICYDTNETMMTKVMNNDANVDVICTSEYGIQKLWNNNYLLKIDKTDGMDTVNQKIYDRTAAKFDKEDDKFQDYFVPYMYGTLGILYNADIFEEYGIDIEEEGWGILWNNQEHAILKNKVLMKDSIRDTYAAGALYLKEQGLLPEGYESCSAEDLINCTDDVFVDAVEEALIDQKKTLSRYEVDFGKDDLINQKAYVDLAWSGDAMYAIEEAAAYDINLDYYVPEAGANIWFDGWLIPTCTSDKTAATYFIEYMCRPAVSMANMTYVGYSSAIDKDIMMNDDYALAILTDVTALSYLFEDDDYWDLATDVGVKISAKDKQTMSDRLYDIKTQILLGKEDALAELEKLVNDITGGNDECLEYLYDSEYDTEEFFVWEVRYPDIDNLNYGMMTEYGKENAKMTIMWEEVKAATDSPMWQLSLICLAVIIGVAGLAVGGYFLWKKLKYDRRKI